MPAKNYFIALDQGTTSCRTIVFNEFGEKITTVQKEFTQYYPQSGWVEHDAEEIWLTQWKTLQEAVEKAHSDGVEWRGIGITNQRETTVIWNKHTGKPIYNAIVWQDRRTAPLCEQMVQIGLYDYIRSQTGLVPDAYFSGTKIHWLLNQVPGAMAQAQQGDLLFGTIDTWLLWKLTNGEVHATDYTNASRTLIFNIHQKAWDHKLLNVLQIPESLLPKVYPSMHHYGTVTLRKDMQVPIVGIAGDQQAALYGQDCTNVGDVKNTYGTGCFMLLYTADKPVISQFGLLTTLAISADGGPAYALEGSVFIAGAAIQWLRDGLQILNTSSESETIAAEVSSAEGVVVVPAFAGLGAPHWDMHARGSIFGITRNTKKAHIVRAVLESIAFQTKDLLDAMVADTHLVVNALKVDGGASANDLLMQIQANVCNRLVIRPNETESTAWGAAKLAMKYTGFEYKPGERGTDKIFRPEKNLSEIVQLYTYWKKAVERTKHWLDPV